MFNVYFLNVWDLIDTYYNDYTFKQLVNSLRKLKEPGDECTILLASKWLQRNITIISPERDWGVYDNIKDDIVIIYRGQMREDEMRFQATTTYQEESAHSK